MPWWSFTKTTLAAAALTLVAQGQLDLDRPVGRRPFTLRQLLQHRAGLANYGRLAAYHEAVRNGEAPWPRERLLRQVEADKLVFEPGQGWAYSNIGYLLVRELIEDATGRDIGTAVEWLVLAPLGISGVKVASLPADLAKTAWGNPAGYHPGWVYHGLLIGPAASAALLLHRLLGGALLPPALLSEMLSASGGRPDPRAAVADGGLRPGPDDRRRRCGGDLCGPYRRRPGKHSGHLPAWRQSARWRAAPGRRCLRPGRGTRSSRVPGDALGQVLTANFGFTKSGQEPGLHDTDLHSTAPAHTR